MPRYLKRADEFQLREEESVEKLKRKCVEKQTGRYIHRQLGADKKELNPLERILERNLAIALCS